MPAAAVVASVGIQAYSQYEAGQENAAAARRNAQLAENAAADALQRGEQKVWMRRMVGQRRIAAQTVAYAHAGVDVQSGTPAKAISDTAMVSELDAQTERNNAYRTAWGYRMHAAALRSAASASERAGNLAAIGALIGGAGKIAGMQSTGPGPDVNSGYDSSGFGGAGEPP
jgi:hypothetical protein